MSVWPIPWSLQFSARVCVEIKNFKTPNTLGGPYAYLHPNLNQFAPSFSLSLSNSRSCALMRWFNSPVTSACFLIHGSFLTPTTIRPRYEGQRVMKSKSLNGKLEMPCFCFHDWRVFSKTTKETNKTTWKTMKRRSRVAVCFRWICPHFSAIVGLWACGLTSFLGPRLWSVFYVSCSSSFV